jgi:hypothetical protein
MREALARAWGAMISAVRRNEVRGFSLSERDFREAMVQVGVDPRTVLGHNLELRRGAREDDLEGAVLIAYRASGEIRLRYESDPLLDGWLPWVMEPGAGCVKPNS